MEQILYPTLVLGGLGAVFGLLLAVASRVFKVDSDPRIAAVINALPGNNCGACGYPGCAAYAEAVVTQCAPNNLCTPGGPDTSCAIAEIMGQEVCLVEAPRKTAFVRCRGTGALAPSSEGIVECAEAEIPEGADVCAWGCVGRGSCVRACKFGAITLEDGFARVLEDHCVACGACVKACPRGLIVLLRADRQYRVACMSTDKGADVKRLCPTGCLGCGICVRACPEKAISLENNLAAIDEEKCVSCGICAPKCPAKTITSPPAPEPQEE
jgi:Na+-translocating ferredoxin:NAD+ oxidoreductase RNF subunit RnfB